MIHLKLWITLNTLEISVIDSLYLLFIDKHPRLFLAHLLFSLALDKVHIRNYFCSSFSKWYAPKPRHNVQFICTRFLAGGLRKIFRTVRICLFAYCIKERNNNWDLPLRGAFCIFHFRPSVSIPCYRCEKSMNRKMRPGEDLR